VCFGIGVFSRKNDEPKKKTQFKQNIARVEHFYNLEKNTFNHNVIQIKYFFGVSPVPPSVEDE
jgi:hypothetical protein